MHFIIYGAGAIGATSIESDYLNGDVVLLGRLHGATPTPLRIRLGVGVPQQ